jgi:hypothetical protein
MNFQSRYTLQPAKGLVWIAGIAANCIALIISKGADIHLGRATEFFIFTGVFQSSSLSSPSILIFLRPPPVSF